MTKEQTLTVKWILPEKNDRLIKFVELSNPSVLGEKVYDLNFEKLGIVAGAKVKVKLEKDEDHDVVTHISFYGDESKVPEPNTKEEKQEKTEDKDILVAEKVLTVHGITAPPKKGIIFKEEEKTWYDLKEGITKETLGQKNIVSGSKVTVCISKAEKGNDIIESIELTPEDKEEKPSNSYSNSNKKGSSIEAQCAVIRAFDFVGNLNINELKDDQRKKLIEDYSNFAYNLIQDLKK